MYSMHTVYYFIYCILLIYTLYNLNLGLSLSFHSTPPPPTTIASNNSLAVILSNSTLNLVSLHVYVYMRGIVDGKGLREKLEGAMGVISEGKHVGGYAYKEFVGRNSRRVQIIKSSKTMIFLICYFCYKGNKVQIIHFLFLLDVTSTTKKVTTTIGTVTMFTIDDATLVL